MIGVAILGEGPLRPQRRFAGLPHSFQTGLVEDVSKSRSLTEPA
jgi:hypothetical protein